MRITESRRGEHREQDPAGVRTGKAFPYVRTARREIGELPAARGREPAPGRPGQCHIGWNAGVTQDGHGAFALCFGTSLGGRPRAAQVPDRSTNCREQPGHVGAEVADCLRERPRANRPAGMDPGQAEKLADLLALACRQADAQRPACQVAAFLKSPPCGGQHLLRAGQSRPVE